jgi:tetratricopeptide (TPR) repeat protein
MSLLLDALKKAADDKKASQKTDAGKDSERLQNPSPVADESQSDISAEPELTLEQVTEDVPLPVDIDQAKEPEPELELSLDEPEAIAASVSQPEPAQVTQASPPATSDADEALASGALSLEDNVPEAPSFDKGTRTVSDEALTMLIYKTNRDIRRQRVIVITSAVLVSLLLLLSGGFYFYTDMRAEIASVEQRHRLSMQAMQTKVNREGAPEQTKIIRELVSDKDLGEKVKFAKQQVAQKPVPAKPKQTVTAAAENEPAANESLIIQKTKKADPIESRLQRAWQAYESGQVEQAEQLYNEIVAKEPNNRDALLGLGATALVQNNNARAMDVYMKLLDLDPLDPIATAALSGILGGKDADERYLKKAAEKNPDAPAINAALGQYYARRNEWKTAQQYYFNAWQQDATNPDYLYNIAVCMDQLDKPVQALRFYRDSLAHATSRRAAFSREQVEKRINELSGSGS